MLKFIAELVVASALAAATSAAGQEEHHHDHSVPEHLGSVRIATSCDSRIEARFNRADALLHSFAYAAARRAFAETLAADPHCAMALWGEAMTHYHPIWEPNVDSEAELAEGAAEIAKASVMSQSTPRERAYIAAMGQYYREWQVTPPAVRAQRFSDAMAGVARDNPADDEAQVFYALTLIAIASPVDRTHAKQKRAAAILETLWRAQPDHPGIAHYLIHAYDSAELAPRGLAPARAYSKIAPSAPHALHMPSHIYTRLGLWNDSVVSNLAARAPAHAQGDIGEELHAMDYLTYALLQLGRYDEAHKVSADAQAMTHLNVAGFKIGYAANAIPVRVAVETRDWAGAARLAPRQGSTPRTAALVWWARALGRARGRPAEAADADIAALVVCQEKLRAAGDSYGATQVDALVQSARAWDFERRGDVAAAASHLTNAADEEDSLEKLPTTPGPIVPAREQLGELLLANHRPNEALAAFNAALALAPNRRGALEGAIAAARQAGKPAEAARLHRQLTAFDVTR